MADILNRINSYKEKKQNAGIVDQKLEQEMKNEQQAQQEAQAQPLRPTVAVQAPASSVTGVQTVQSEKAEASALPENLPGVKPWQEMSAQEAFTAHPQLSPAAYLSGVAEYRDKNGLPGMSWPEITAALGGRDPMKSIEQAEKEERRLRAAERINAIGSVLANIINFGRTKAGNPEMNLSGVGTQGQARIDRLRAYGQRLAAQNLQDYMGGLNRERAEKAQEAVREAQQRRWEAQQKAKQEAAERDYRFGVYKFEADQAGKAAERARRQQAEKSKLEETARHNRSMESIGRTRVAAEGKENVNESIMSSDGYMWTRSTRLSSNEAKQMVNNSGITDDELERYRKTYKDEDGNIVRTGEIDWNSALADAITNGMISSDELEARAFKKRPKKLSYAQLGWGEKWDGERKKNNDIDW